MLFQRYGKFTGGIDLPEEKEATLDEPISSRPLPEELCVGLKPCGGKAAQPTVSTGQSVSQGERIANASGEGVDIFAPLAGLVGEVTSNHIRLTELRGSSDLSMPEPECDWTKKSADELFEKIRDSQLSTFRPQPRPVADWLEESHRHHCWQLVVNAMEDQPFVTADHRLLVEHGPEIIEGVKIMAKAAHISRVILAADQSRTSDYQHLTDPAEVHEINRVALPRRYPIGADNILLSVLTGKEVPCGGRPADIGLAITNPATCLAVYRWVACNQRLNGRVVTLAGPNIKRPANVLVPFGTNCYELASPAEPPIVIGSPMIGRIASPRSVVGPGTDAILALKPTKPGSSTQCIRCGWCRDHCPTRLNVAVLNDLYELGHVEPADDLGALSCLGCGVCTYICPARLPLTERVRQLKLALHSLPGRGQAAAEAENFARQMRKRGTRKKWLQRKKKKQKEKQ